MGYLDKDRENGTEGVRTGLALPIKADLYSLLFVSYVKEERMSILLAQNKEKIAKSFRKHWTKMEEAIADFVPDELPPKIVVDQDFLAYLFGSNLL